jgi:hypothetical protein
MATAAATTTGAAGAAGAVDAVDPTADAVASFLASFVYVNIV